MDASDQAECAAKPGSGIEENKSDMVLPSVLLLVSSIFGGLTLPKLYTHLFLQKHLIISIIVVEVSGGFI